MFCAEIMKIILTSFHNYITIGDDVTFSLIKKLNKQLSELSICKSNTELKCGLTD